MNLSEYINTIKDKKIGVIGIGISNIPLIRLLSFSGVDVTALDAHSIDELGADAFELLSIGVKLKLGKDYLDNLDYDVIFRTPGLMPFDEHLVRAEENGAIVTSEMEVFFKVCPCRIIAVTGSDGKTTTTTIISELLKAAGYAVHLGGNIGHPLLCDSPFMNKDDVAVLELSSFQLHSMDCHPNISVITNISPNHLDKHKDYQDYITAKKSVFNKQNGDDILVLNADDELVSSFKDEAESKIRFFGMEKGNSDGVYSYGGSVYRLSGGIEKKILDVSEILLPGEHNVKNYIAAFAATDGLVNDGICKSVAASFKGVEHRLESVREVNGVKYINDSIGSSPSRTIAGLKSFSNKPVIILGGYDKKIPFDSLGEEVCNRAKAAVITGDTAMKIKAAIENAPGYNSAVSEGFKLYLVDEFDEAVNKAREIAKIGDTVLFSPACASFDHFKNFEERGNHFKKLVMEF